MRWLERCLRRCSGSGGRAGSRDERRRKPSHLSFKGPPRAGGQWRGASEHRSGAAGAKRNRDLSSQSARTLSVASRTLVPLALVACTLSASASADSAGGSAAHPALHMGFGITVTLPPGWHVVRRRLTPCSDPSERVTVAGRGGLVMVQERLHAAPGEFPPRPARFELRGSPHPMECCAPLTRGGWFLRFGESGRGFYVYVYPGGRGTRAEALAILDGLRIKSPRL
jgi:hypothetical protein